MGGHVNQPGGPFRASVHPAAAGRERELRRLADAVRRLVAATVEHVAPAEETARLAADVEALAARVEATVPDPLPPRYVHPDLLPPEDRHAHDGSQFDYVIGLYNPVALPVEMEVLGDRAIGRAVFTTPYEGPPGCVHGAVLAACFDQVFVLATTTVGAGGPTVRLEMDFLRPTPLRREVVFEAWVERVEGRTIHTAGRVRAGETVCVEARGVFVAMDRTGVERLRQPRDGPGS
jgi:acyl-coenzyme A thioesterase PaaI-like protein